MKFAVGKTPDEPCVNRAKGEITINCFHPCSRHIVEKPFYLASTKIGINFETGFFSNFFSVDFADLVADLRCSAILPDNSIVYRFAGLAVPYNSRFTLIGYSNGSNVGGIEICFSESLDSSGDLRYPNFLGIVFDKAALRIDLSVFHLTN